MGSLVTWLIPQILQTWVHLSENDITYLEIMKQALLINKYLKKRNKIENSY
jgi:hypothetical protein